MGQFTSGMTLEVVIKVAISVLGQSEVVEQPPFGQLRKNDSTVIFFNKNLV